VDRTCPALDFSVPFVRVALQRKLLYKLAIAQLRRALYLPIQSNLLSTGLKSALAVAPPAKSLRTRWHTTASGAAAEPQRRQVMEFLYK